MAVRITSKLLDGLAGITHGFFGREGGVSKGLYESLNIGLGSRDDLPNVRENRARIAAELGLTPDRLLTPYQIHGADVVVAETPWAPGPYAPRADGVVSKVAGLGAGVSTADCTPILFADARARVVGAAHAGWRGALGGILEATIDRLIELGATRTGLVAAVGPTISQANYEIGEDFRATFIAADADNKQFFVPGEKGRPHFDLPGYVTHRLRRAGIGEIDSFAICTYAQEHAFFSFRRATHRDERDYGRQVSAIALKQ